jgi:NADH-quinone oxidoreductase subunit J
VTETFIFYFFGLALTGAAIGVITARNPVHAAMFLVFAFVNSAFLWMLLEAEFLAIVLVLVYVGAVMVLFLFVVMMLEVKTEALRGSFTRYAPLGLGLLLIVVAELGYVVWTRTQEMTFLQAPARAPAEYSNTEMLGNLLYTEYVYAFELAAVILLVAIVAAIALTMRHRPGLKVQDVAKQVAVRREDRVRIVNVESADKR